MRSLKLVLASLLVVFIFSYGVGVGRYDWFPSNEIQETKRKLDGVIEKLSLSKKQDRKSVV